MCSIDLVSTVRVLSNITQGIDSLMLLTIRDSTTDNTFLRPFIPTGVIWGVFSTKLKLFNHLKLGEFTRTCMRTSHKMV